MERQFRQASGIQGRWRLRVSYDTAFEGHKLRTLIEGPDEWLRSGSARVLKQDNTTTVAVESNGDHRWVLKRYNTKNPWHFLRRSFQRSRADICWVAALWLLELGVATPRPIAWVEERLGPFKGRSYYITEYVAGTPLVEFLDDQDKAGEEVVVAQIGRLFRSLRVAGLSHGDMKASNFIVHRHQIYLLDLDAMCRHEDGLRLDQAYRRDRSRFVRNWDDRPALKARFERVIPQRPGD